MTQKLANYFGNALFEWVIEQYNQLLLKDAGGIIAKVLNLHPLLFFVK
jgi:hypothetical protein